MNPFFNDSSKDEVPKKKRDDSELESSESEEIAPKPKKDSKKEKAHKTKDGKKKDKSAKKAKKQDSSSSDSEYSSSEEEEKPKKSSTKKSEKSSKSKEITHQERVRVVSDLFEGDHAVTKKVVKTLELFQDHEISEKKVISKLIKICGIDGAKTIIENVESIFSQEKLIDAIKEANKTYNWPNLITSIEDNLKEETYEDDDESIKKLVDDYTSLRKDGVKLRKRAIGIMKKLDKKSSDYKKIRSIKKQLDNLQEECDRCTDEEDVDAEELGELILQYSEKVNELVSLLSGPIETQDSSDSDNDSDSDSKKTKKKIHMPKFYDEDEDDSEKQRIFIHNRKAVYKAVIKEQNGKLSMSHITLEPRAQATIPLPVQANEVIGFCWKEETNSRMLFKCILSMSNSDIDAIEVVPLQVRISEYHMIYKVPQSGVLRLGWDNGLSVRKSKEIDVFVKRFDPEHVDEVMNAENKRAEAWRQIERSDLTEGNMEGGRLTLKLTERVMTEDGVKYTCHCDWENSFNLKTSWDVQYPYLVWLEWYKAIAAKYPTLINKMAPFTGTALMTTKAVIAERLTKINAFFQDLVKDKFMMETPEVVSWFRCQESIRKAKRQYYEEFKKERERKQQEQEEAEKKAKEQEEAEKNKINEEEMFDPLSYLCA